MPITITMPRLSDTMEEGTLIKWKVQEGDKVKSGDLLADVETDKATMELQSFDDGTVAKLAVGEGQSAKVGALILVLAEEGESVEDAAKAGGSGTGEMPKAQPGGKPGPATEQTTTASQEDITRTPAATGQVEDEGSDEASTGDSGRVRVSPVARKMAEDMGVDISTVKGSGPDGRIIKRDILAAAEGKPSAPRPGGAPTAAQKPAPPAPAPSVAVARLESRLVPVSNMRKTIARRLVESKSTIPHFTVTVAVDADPLLALRGTLNEQLASQGIKLSVNDFIVRGAALALVQHPMLNSSWTDAGIQVHGSVNVGVAVALPQERGGGLVVPTLRDAHAKGLRAISTETRQLADKARTRGLSVEEMSDGTFTVSNLGMLGVEHFEAIINPPQSAILAIGAALQKPVVRDGQIVVGSEMTLTLSADHRVVDGAMGAEYLQTLRQMLENPAVLLV